MTDATTADVLAMRRLILEHKLSLWWHHTAWATEDGYGLSQHRGYGPTDVAAVRAWAEAAGVEWQPPQVEKRWTFRTEGGGIASAYTSPELAAAVMEREGYGETAAANYVVPCEVVIRTEAEATP